MKQEIMTISKQRQLAPRIFEMTLTGELVNEMRTPGQFLHLRVPQNAFLLRRPISINHIDAEKKECRIIYRVEGDGTRIFSEMTVGDPIDVMGPLGNGFRYHHLNQGDTAFIVSGGIGVPPLYELSKRLTQQGVHVIHFLGFASKDVMYYEEEFRALGDTRIATDDGSAGLQGNVGNLLLAAEQTPAAVFACGNNGLLKTTAQLFEDLPDVQLSMEARMACGMGACYACVCHTKDDEQGTKSVKVCDEGPVFQARKVVI
ncbi:dihydroorotate dehydrogenase electron transfer subunit [Enterococcus casseliflavus]|uniref:dihydroorotate dehydrogenase electron transfer subunit n=1 Tax=Enterococcus casseliflavus TaxID=37734 RepID=UPI0035CC7A1F